MAKTLLTLLVFLSLNATANDINTDSKSWKDIDAKTIEHTAKKTDTNVTTKSALNDANPFWWPIPDFWWAKKEFKENEKLTKEWEQLTKMVVVWWWK